MKATRRQTTAHLEATRRQIAREGEAAQRMALEVAQLAAEFAHHADSGDYGTLGSIQEIRIALVNILARRSPTYALDENCARNEVLAEHGLV